MNQPAEKHETDSSADTSADYPHFFTPGIGPNRIAREIYLKPDPSTVMRLNAATLCGYRDILRRWHGQDFDAVVGYQRSGDIVETKAAADTGPAVPKPQGPLGVEALDRLAGDLLAGKRCLAPDLLQAAQAAMADRAAERDIQSERSMRLAVDVFATLTGIVLTERDGWMFMAMLKAARSQRGATNLDDYIDGAAYLALAGEAAQAPEPLR